MGLGIITLGSRKRGELVSSKVQIRRRFRVRLRVRVRLRSIHTRSILEAT